MTSFFKKKLFLREATLLKKKQNCAPDCDTNDSDLLVLFSGFNFNHEHVDESEIRVNLITEPFFPVQGELRFSKPVEPKPWTGLRNGSYSQSIRCPQTTSLGPGGLVYGQEDCLYLNVYAPGVS